MRKALVVGIDYYKHLGSLTGCVNDAYGVKAMLDRHADGSVNFGVRLLAGTGTNEIVTKAELKDAVRELLGDDAEIALFYFAGHGYIDDTGGFLCASDCSSGDEGLSLNEVMTWRTNQKRKTKSSFWIAAIAVLLETARKGPVLLKSRKE